MRNVAVAAAALNQTPIAWIENVKNIVTAVRQARTLKAQVLCLPELCITGYGCEDAFHSPGLLSMALDRLFEVAKECSGMVVNVGLPLEVGGAVFNVVCVIVDAQVTGFVAKKNLAGDGLHYEPRWFKPWPRGVVTSVEIRGVSYPVGDLLFDIDGIKIGFEICEDAWVGDRAGIDLAANGADIILNPSASHFAFGKHEIRKRFVQEGSRSFGVTYLYANLLGCESGRIIFDGDTLVAANGELVARGPRFSYQDVVVVAATVDVDRTRLSRYRQASFVPQLTHDGRCVTISGIKLGGEGTSKEFIPAEWEGSKELKHEEFWRAVALGLFDYVRKSHSQGFVVSLSGGVDSSAASCLVSLMVHSAVRELGKKGFKEKLPFTSSAKSNAQLIHQLLACVYQGTENSSAITRTAAQEVARELGATFIDLYISDLVAGYEALISKATGTKLTWKEHDIARQNIQARVRSPSAWLIANLRGALLLSTSNRSEAAVGYTTMDGDSSGGLSPLGGIDKAYLREWLRWLETSGPADIAQKYPSLRLVNAQAPTAELRPLKEKQTDEGDLMPYRVLDKVERYAVRDRCLPTEVFFKITSDFSSEYERADLSRWTARFFTLWSANQWKRERYAPSFHLDDENVDPKTWCRFPILSGGYKEELRELARLR